MLQILLLANAVWFAMAFNAFYLRRKIFAKIMVPVQDDRDNTAYQALIESGRFMGGFNLALSLLNVGLFFNVAGLETDRQWAGLLIFAALAHGSQFFGNVPMAQKNWRGEGLWNVFKGPMLMIFVVDFVLMILNAALAINFLL